MNYLYCQHCFKKTAQTSDIVKFCSHCGKPFNEVATHEPHAFRRTPSSTTNSIVETTSSTRNVYRKILAKRGIKEVEEDDNDNIDEDNDLHDMEEDVHVPDIDKLDVDVEIPQSKGVSVKSLAKNAPRKPRVDSNVKRKKRDKNFLSDYLRSTASIRPK